MSIKIESTPIGEVIEAYNRAKEIYQEAVKDVIEKAKSLGCDPKSADNVHNALAHLLGYRMGASKRKEH